MRFLHLKFINSGLSVPEVLLGTFSNFDGTSVYAGSVIMQNIREDIKAQFDDKNPETYYYPQMKGGEKIPEDKNLIENSGVHPGVKRFFESKQNNLVKMPSSRIKTLNDLSTWKSKKKEIRAKPNQI